MDHKTNPLLAPIRATFEGIKREAMHRAPGGDLLDHDLPGLYRRTARLHGCTPEQVRDWTTPAMETAE